MIVTADGLVSVPKIDLEFGSREDSGRNKTEARISNRKTVPLDEPRLSYPVPMVFPSGIEAGNSGDTRRPEIRFPFSGTNRPMKTSYSVSGATTWSSRSEEFLIFKLVLNDQVC